MATVTDRLANLLRQRIEDAGGWLPFDAFMHAALYEPHLGYYECHEVFGEQGDFVTAADLGPWLALALADLTAWAWQKWGRPKHWRLMEQGGGSGRLLTAVCECLADLDVPPPTIVQSVEKSHGMRELQRKIYDAASLEVDQLADLAEARSGLPTLFFCNELVDALPVRCFCWQGGKLYERGVTLQGNGFAWVIAAEELQDPPEIEHDICRQWPEGYCSEWRPVMAAWQRQLAEAVGQGYVVSVDYGFPQGEYYRPQRIEGTLLAHTGHQAFADVLTAPGQRDITAHVDFTAMCRAGQMVGLQPVCFTSQGAWLAQSPSVCREIERLAVSPGEHAGLLAHAKRLMLPFGMGELFKLCLQSVNAPKGRPEYLVQFDQLPRLRL